MMQTQTPHQWPLLARWLALAGMVGAIVLGLLSYQNVHNRVAALARMAVPGHITVDVPQPTELTIYYEDPAARGGFMIQANGSSTLAYSPVHLAISGPSGEPIATVPYERDLRFNHDGRVVTALATFDARTAGAYTVDVNGDVGAGALVSVGDVVDVGLIAEVGSALALFVGSLLLLLATVTVTWIKRRATTAIPIHE